jgi:hypothetical protein
VENQSTEVESYSELLFEKKIRVRFPSRRKMQSLLVLASVNVCLTLFVEVVLRGFIFPSLLHMHEAKLMIHSQTHFLIHKQTVINCLMTFSASILGGLSYFMPSRFFRWVYFGLFGIANSIFAQVILHLTLNYSLNDLPERVIFDLFYSLSLRFFFFELFRQQILNTKFKVFKLTGWRSLQDFSLAALRIAILTVFKFSSN